MVSELIAVVGMTDSGNERRSFVIHSKDLILGMELAEDLVAPNNVLLLSKNHVLDDSLIDKILALEAALGSRFNIRVYVNE